MRRLADLARRPLVLTLASSSLIQGLSVLTGVVLARVLGPEHRGELGTIILWPSVVAAIAILGLPDAVSVLTAGRAIALGDAIRSALRVIALLSVAGVVVLAAVVVSVTTGMDAPTRFAAVAYIAFLPINMATLVLVGALTGRQRFGALNAVRVSVVLVAAVGLPLLASTGLLTVTTAVVTYVLANVVALAIALASVVPLSRPGIGGSWSNARLLLDFGIRSHAGVVAGIVGERLDQLAISAFLPTRQYGLYLAAIALSTGSAIVSTSVITVLVPVVAAAPPALRLTTVRRYLRITAILTGGIALLSACLAPLLLSVLFGATFLDAALPAQVLLIGTVPLALSRALASASRASGHPLRASRAEWLSLSVAVPAYALLLPWAGLVGAALASVVAYSASLLFQAYIARSNLGARSVRDLVRKGHWEPASDITTEGVTV